MTSSLKMGHVHDLWPGQIEDFLYAHSEWMQDGMVYICTRTHFREILVYMFYSGLFLRIVNGLLFFLGLTIYSKISFFFNYMCVFCIEKCIGQLSQLSAKGKWGINMYRIWKTKFQHYVTYWCLRNELAGARSTNGFWF